MYVLPYAIRSLQSSSPNYIPFSTIFYAKLHSVLYNLLRQITFRSLQSSSPNYIPPSVVSFSNWVYIRKNKYFTPNSRSSDICILYYQHCQLLSDIFILYYQHCQLLSCLIFTLTYSTIQSYLILILSILYYFNFNHFHSCIEFYDFILLIFRSFLIFPHSIESPIFFCLLSYY